MLLYTNKLNLPELSGKSINHRKYGHKHNHSFTCDKCGGYFGKKKESKIKNICVNCEDLYEHKG